MTKESGKKAAVHLVILHGWAIDPEMKLKWQPLLDALEKQNIKTHFLPLPGLAKDLKEPWDLNDYAEWLDQEIDKIKKKLGENDKLTLLGHSFGGQILARYLSALGSSSPIDKLILVSSGGLRNHSAWAEFKRLSFKRVAKIGKKIMPPETGSPEGKKLGKLFKKLLYKFVREQDYLLASPIQRKTMANILEDEIWDDLPKIKIPTLIIWGEQDTVTPFKLARTFQEKISGSILITIPEARHSPVYTHVERVSEAVKNFTTS